MKEKSTERVPVWALYYIVNGDATGLTDSEVEMIDNLYHTHHIELISPDYESEPYFSHNPWFGKPCDVVDCTVIMHS